MIPRRMGEKMLTYKRFIAEGGNVQIGDVEADRIDLKSVDRSMVVNRIGKVLKLVNLMYQRRYGVPLWNPSLFKSKQFLSGSSMHFFDVAIPTPEFKKYKNTVGDIDTQVDSAQKDNIKEFLTHITGQTFNYVTMVGFKQTAAQFITLWSFKEPRINVQIDFEMVDFEHGFPTAFSRFSHSSSWEDMKEGIKGVFHKYMLRALTSTTRRKVFILKMVGRGKARAEQEQLVDVNSLAFSIDRGLRNKLEPVLDEHGIHRRIGDIPVFREIEPKDSTYITDLEVIFESLFNTAPSKQDLKDFGSFIGLLKLIRNNLDSGEIRTVAEAFTMLLWEPKAQGLYRADPTRDQNDKLVAYYKMVEGLGVRIPGVDDLRTEYYGKYK